MVCAVTLALFGCGGDRQSSPTAAGATAAAHDGDGSVSAQAAEPKVTICHLPPGNPENAQTITIGASAVPAHLANHEGDAVGPCPEPSPSPSPTPSATPPPS